MSHTPGPWRWAEYYNGLSGPNGEEVLAFADHEGMYLVNEDGDGPLIAAAPDLLVACKIALEHGDLFNHDAEFISAAIAKAEGKKPLAKGTK